MPAYIHIQRNGQALPGTHYAPSYLHAQLVDYTQVVSFYNDLTASQDNRQPVPIGPYTVVKNVDHISPMIVEAMTGKMEINAQIKFYGVVSNDGQLDEVSRITLLGGRITGIRTEVQYIDQSAANIPLERISIMPGSVRWESPLGGEFHEYTP